MLTTNPDHIEPYEYHFHVHKLNLRQPCQYVLVIAEGGD